MNLDSAFLRRTGRTQRMIEAAIKAATGQDESGKPKDVMIVTGSRENSRIFRQIHERLSRTFNLSAFDSNKAENCISFTFCPGSRIRVISNQSASITPRLTVYGHNGPTFVDHFAIEEIYAPFIEKWLEFTNEPGKS